MYLQAVAVSLLMVAAPARSTTIEFRPVCDLVASSDVTLQVKVRSAEDLCVAKGWKCGGTLYVAIPIDASNSSAVAIVSPEQLNVGSSYTVFAKRVREGDPMFLFSSGHSAFAVPEGVDYYVDPGSAFKFNGQDYSRELPDVCVGDGPDCMALNAISPKGSASVMSASVRYTGFEEQVRQCPR